MALPSSVTPLWKHTDMLRGVSYRYTKSTQTDNEEKPSPATSGGKSHVKSSSLSELSGQFSQSPTLLPPGDLNINRELRMQTDVQMWDVEKSRCRRVRLFLSAEPSFTHH